MKTPPRPSNENDRLSNLLELEVLDSAPEKELDELVRLASSISDCPISLISLVDQDRQWFKARYGLEATETPRDISFCGHAIEGSDDIFEVVDAREDDRFSDNPLVTGNPDIRFYAGKPLITSEGNRIGTICVIDRKPKKLTIAQRHQLKILSEIIIRTIESKKILGLEKRELIARQSHLTALSHEIRTPLTSVIGYTELVKEELTKKEPSIEELRGHVNIIQESSEHLLNLVKGVLESAKIQAGKIAPKFEPVNIRPFLKNLEHLFRLKAEAKGIDFRVEISEQLPHIVHTDQTLLKQVLINLIGNSFKFTPQGYVHCFISTDTVKNKLIFDVKDSGIGLSGEEKKTLFSPFATKVDSQNKYDSTGIGLYISHKIVGALGGNLTLKSSESGKGTHFQFVIPVNDQVSVASLVKKTKKEARTNLIDGRRKILVIDDNEENRVLVKYFLKDQGIDVDEAENAQSAIEKFKENEYDFILVDIHLPDASGYDVIEFFQEVGIPEFTQMYAFTALTASEQSDLIEKSGFNGFIQKPFSKEELISKLNS